MHRKHGIDRGTEVTEGSEPGEGIPVGLGCRAPSPRTGVVDICLDEHVTRVTV